MKRPCESPSIQPSDPSPSGTALAPEPQPGGGDEAGGDAGTALAPGPQHWPERHRRGIDLAVVALVLVYNQLVLPVPAQGPVPWLLEALCPGLALAYLLRRRRSFSPGPSCSPPPSAGYSPSTSCWGSWSTTSRTPAGGRSP